MSTEYVRAETNDQQHHQRRPKNRKKKQTKVNESSNELPWNELKFHGSFWRFVRPYLFVINVVDGSRFLFSLLLEAGHY